MKAYFKNCDLAERKLFKYSNCIMPISVGQGLQVHEGDKLLATFHLVNKSFKSCTLLIDDTLQRHTLKMFSNESESAIMAKTLFDGDEWLNRNKSIYELLNINFNITRWNDWLKHPEYLPQRVQLDELYHNNAYYKTIVNMAIHTYVDRALIRKNIKFDEKHVHSCCLDYLLEESAVMCLWARENYDFELYPSGRNHAMQVTYDSIIKQNRSFGKLISVSLYFRK